MSKQKSLVTNTIFLYILTFSNYFFSFITTPIQTRVLGVENYGRIGFATAFMAYFQIVVEYGFILSATEMVARNRDDKNKLSKILSSVISVKIVLAAICFCIVLGLCLFIPKFREDWILYLLVYISVVLNAFMPDFLYRGLEEMKIITIRSVIIRIFFTFMIIIFLRKPEDYYLIPILNCISALGALGIVYLHVYKKIGVRFVKVSLSEMWSSFKSSSQFFLSRIAGTIYSATNTFVLGMVYPTGSAVVGLFTSADKLVSTSKNCFSPISDSLYPYMVKNRDFKMVKKVLAIFMPIIVIGGTVVSVIAEPLCAWFFGEEFREAGRVLRCLMPIVVITLPEYILGFPTLSPVGLAKYANYSVVFAAVLQIIMLGGLVLFGKFNVYTLSIVTAISECSVLLYRIVIIIRNRDKFYQGRED